MRLKLAVIIVLVIYENVTANKINKESKTIKIYGDTGPVTFPGDWQCNDNGCPTTTMQPLLTITETSNPCDDSKSGKLAKCFGCTGNSKPNKPATIVKRSGNCINFNACQNVSNDVTKAFYENGIVPQIIPCPPTQIFRNKLGSKDISLGTFISAFTLGFDPYAVRWTADPGSLYTLVFINADVNYILQGTFKFLFLPLLIVNIPGDNVDAGDTLVGYRPYLPIPGFLHRYVGLVYRQTESIDVTLHLIRSVSTTSAFDLGCFVETYNLGDPIFGNFAISSL